MNYTIIGAGRSGIASALLAKELGNNVFLTESNPKEDLINLNNDKIINSESTRLRGQPNEMMPIERIIY
jgi:Trk K+ transport system NAD-binding subunit